MKEWEEVSFDQFIERETWIGDKTKREMISSLLRLNNKRSVEHSTLSSMIELQLASGKGYSLRPKDQFLESKRNGSRLLTSVIEWMFEETKSLIHLNRDVRLISFDHKKRLFSLSTSNNETHRDFDAIVLAIPRPERIVFEGVDLKRGWSGEINTQTVHSTVIKGCLNVTFFGGSDNQPHKILTIPSSEEEDQIQSITVLHKDQETKERTYRVISSEALSEAKLDLLFQGFLLFFFSFPFRRKVTRRAKQREKEQKDTFSRINHHTMRQTRKRGN